MLSVFRRCHSNDHFEIAVKATQGIVAAIQRRLQDRVVGVTNQIASLIDAIAIYVLCVGDPYTFFKIS